MILKTGKNKESKRGMVFGSMGLLGFDWWHYKYFN